jgi:hypothetical protein
MKYMCVEKLWNNSDRGQQKSSEKNLSKCHAVHHKFHLDLPGIDLLIINSLSYFVDDAVIFINTLHSPHFLDF